MGQNKMKNGSMGRLTCLHPYIDAEYGTFLLDW